MIINPTDYKHGTIVECEVCIIGGGPAAISLALSLLEQKCKIVMLTGGSWSETPKNRELNKGFVNPSRSHEPLEKNRRRMFGGATAIWGGRCVPYDPIDFEERSWVPYSGWPITYQQMIPYYEKALALCEAGENNFDARTVFPDKKFEIIPGFDNDDIVSYNLERWSPPTKFAHRYKNELEESTDLHIYLDAHVTSINTESEADTVSSVTAVIKSSEIKVVAGRYILAAGGIENPRLLLSSKSSFHPQGIGNQNDNVGRFYMSHLMGTFGAIDPVDRKEILFPFELDQQGIYCRRRWWLTPKVQKENKLANSIMFLNRPVNIKGYREPTESAILMAKTFIGLVKGKSIKQFFRTVYSSRKDILEHSLLVLKNSFSLIPIFLKAGTNRLMNGKKPLRLPSINAKWLYLYFQTEHVPNPESKVYLSKFTDRLGVALPIIKVAFTELDIQTIIASHKIFFHRFQAQQKGKVSLNEDNLRQMVMDNIENFNSGAHHLGTTRMCEDPTLGVVDKNCQVHGVSNLYIAGSSVFPTGGHANPTLTLIALTLKLGDHLKTVDVIGDLQRKMPVLVNAAQDRQLKK